MGSYVTWDQLIQLATLFVMILSLLDNDSYKRK